MDPLGTLLAGGVALVVVGAKQRAGTLRRNWFVGLRTWETMRSDAAWQAAHSATAGLVIAAGIVQVIAVVSLVLLRPDEGGCSRSCSPPPGSPSPSSSPPGFAATFSHPASATTTRHAADHWHDTGRPGKCVRHWRSRPRCRPAACGGQPGARPPGEDGLPAIALEAAGVLLVLALVVGVLGHVIASRLQDATRRCEPARARAVLRAIRTAPQDAGDGMYGLWVVRR